MARTGGRLAWLALPLAAVAVWIAAHGGTTRHPGDSSPSPSRGGRSSAPDRSTTSQGDATYDPADYAPQVRTYAREAGVDAQLVMTILYNESYKPHDPAFERAWQSHDPDAAFGIANMHRAAFDETKQGRDFADRRWDELPDDRALAVEAAAWFLHDLAVRLPAHWSGPYTRDELLALGYNTGGGNMLAFARGTTPGAQARSYLDRLHDNWTKAAKAVGS